VIWSKSTMQTIGYLLTDCNPFRAGKPPLMDCGGSTAGDRFG
jgi:hypothetical protein